MSEKLTPLLKAWETIKDIGLTHMSYDSDENYDGELEYEAVEVDDGIVEDNFPDECKLIEKSLKALDIIKEKQVLNDRLLMSSGLEAYNRYAKACQECSAFKPKELTQEEYDILKEVLL